MIFYLKILGDDLLTIKETFFKSSEWNHQAKDWTKRIIEVAFPLNSHPRWFPYCAYNLTHNCILKTIMPFEFGTVTCLTRFMLRITTWLQYFKPLILDKIPRSHSQDCIWLSVVERVFWQQVTAGHDTI